MKWDVDHRIPRENRIVLDETEFVIDKYVRGGSSICYFAKTSDGSNYVIKELLPRNQAHVAEETYEERLSREFNLSRRSFYRTFQTAAYCEKQYIKERCLLMTPVPENLCDLNQLIEKLRMEEPLERLKVTLKIVKSLVAGLQELHEECGVMHLDLSLSNIFAGSSADAVTAFFLDFGEARLLKDGKVPVENSFDRPGTTAAFAAPECRQISGTLTPSADLYAAAIIFYHLLCSGAGAYQDEPIPEAGTLSRGSSREVKYGISKLGLPDYIANAVVQLLKKAVAWSPENRYQTAGEMLVALEELCDFAECKGVTRLNLLQRSVEAFEAENKRNNGYIGGTMDETMLPQLDGELRGKVLLVGPGGSGKTTLLLHIWEKLLREAKVSLDAPCPLYVPLYSFSGNNASKRIPDDPSYIRDYILNHYAGKSDGKDDHSRRTDLMRQLEAGRFVLLLDGINEAVDSSWLHCEIKETLAGCDAVHIIITSRYEIPALKNCFRTVNVLPLDNGIIRSKTGKAALSPRLFKVLSRPMFLALYCNMIRDDGIEETLKENGLRLGQIQSPGEILLAHHLRLIQMSEEKTYDDDSKRIRRFVLDQLFPYFAVRTDPMHFHSDVMYANLAPRLENVPLKEKGTVGLVVANPEKTILPNWIAMGLIREVPGKKSCFAFSHQLYHEFYKTYAIKQAMEKRNQDQLCALLNKGVLEDSVLALLGDLWGEYRYEGKTGSPIEKWMQENLGGKRGEEAQTSVRNLVECMKISRQKSVSAKYDGLDLTKTHFYDCSLPNSSFRNTLLRRNTFCAVDGHFREAEAMVWAPRKNYLITFEFGSVYCWNMSSGQLIYEIQTGESADASLDISPDERYLLVNWGGEELEILDLDDGSAVSTYPQTGRETGSMLWERVAALDRSGISLSAFLPDSESIIVGSSDGNKLFHVDVKSGKRLAPPQTIEMRPRSELWDVEEEWSWQSEFYISHDRKKLVVSHRDGILELWDAMSLTYDKQASQQLQPMNGLADLVFSADDRYLIGRSSKNVFFAYDFESGQLITSGECGTGAYNPFFAAPNGVLVRSAQVDYYWNVKLNEVHLFSELPYTKHLFCKVNPQIGSAVYFYADDDLCVHFCDAETLTEQRTGWLGHKTHGKLQWGNRSCGSLPMQVVRLSWAGQLQVMNLLSKEVTALGSVRVPVRDAELCFGNGCIFLNNPESNSHRIWKKTLDGFAEIQLPYLQGRILYADVERNAVVISSENCIRVLNLDDPSVEQYRCEGEGRWLEQGEGRNCENSNRKGSACGSMHCVIPDLCVVVSCSAEGFLQVWDIRTKACVFEAAIDRAPVKKISRIPYTNLVLVEARAKFMSLWDMAHYKKLAVWRENASFLEQRYALKNEEQLRFFFEAEMGLLLEESALSLPEAVAVLFHRPSERTNRSHVRFSEDKQSVAVWMQQHEKILVWKEGNRTKAVEPLVEGWLSDFCLDAHGDSLYIQGDDGTVFGYDLHVPAVGADAAWDEIDEVTFAWLNVDACDVYRCNFTQAIYEDGILRDRLKMNGAIV